MVLDDRFEELAGSLAGFYRTWFVFAGLELGLLRELRDAGETGLGLDELAEATGTDAGALGAWAWGAEAHELVTVEDGRLRAVPDVAAVLLDPERPEYLGGQFVHAATASLDYGLLLDWLRTGRPMTYRPDRYRIAIERLTVQDVAVFFQEALAALPQLVVDLRPGSRIVDVHCGGARWLIAMAKRFPGTTLVGVEFEPDSVERARRNVAEAGLTDRIAIEEREHAEARSLEPFDLVYYQYALHQLPDPVDSLGRAWRVVRPGGRVVVLDWYLPEGREEFLTRHGELIAGVHLDERFSGLGLARRDDALGWFEAAGIPRAELVDLPSGASVIVALRADREEPGPG